MTSWNSVGEISADAMGRSRGKVEGMTDLLQRLQAFEDAVLDPEVFPDSSGDVGRSSQFQAFCSWTSTCLSWRNLGSLSSNVTTVAKPIVSDRLNFRGRPDFDAPPF